MKSLRFEPLEARQMLSAISVVESEFNGSRREADTFVMTAADVVTLQGRSTNHDDKDFFSFTSPTTDTLSISVSNTGAPVQLEIEDRFGNDVFETEPNDGINSGTVELQEGMTYFIRLRSKENRQASNYSVELGFGDLSTTPPGGEPGNTVTEVEPNGGKSNATRFDLATDGEVQLKGVSVGHKDKDYFVFTARESGNLRINVESTGSDGVQLEIEDRTGDSIFETEPNDGQNSGAVDVVAGETYFVRMRAKDKASETYAVDLAFHDLGGGDPDDPGGEPGDAFTDSEPNGGKSNATRFDLGTDGFAELSGVSNGHDDKDYFVFTARQSGRLRVSVEDNGAGRDGVQLEIEDRTGDSIFETEPRDGDNSGSVNIVAGQTYFVRLRATDDAALTYLASLTLEV